MKTIRIPLVLAALAAAVASQALVLNYAGNGPLNGNTTTSLGLIPGDQFGFDKSVTSTGKIVLSDLSGANGLSIVFPGLMMSALYSGLGTATGFGSYAGFAGAVNSTSGTTINQNSYGVFVQGNINPVPEPSAFAALGLGAFGLLRRRRKA